MTRKRTFPTGLCLVACALLGAAAAQAHGSDGPQGMSVPRAGNMPGDRPFGGFESRERFPQGRPGGDYGPRGYERPWPARDTAIGGRREPGIADEPYSPSRYAPPRYAAPPPRRPFQPMPGWRAAPETAPRLNEGGVAPLGRVIENLQRHSPGRQLDAEVGYLGERPVYRVLWLTAHGRRMDYVVDAETGAIISER